MRADAHVHLGGASELQRTSLRDARFPSRGWFDTDAEEKETLLREAIADDGNNAQARFKLAVLVKAHKNIDLTICIIASSNSIKWGF